MKKQVKILEKLPIPFEVKRNNRFVVEFPKEIEIESWVIQSITKPKLINGCWANIDIVMLDPINPSTSQAVMKMIEYCDKNKPSLFSKKRSLFTFTIKVLDPVGVEVEEWVINVEEFLSADFGNVDYSSDDIQKIKISLQPLNCKLLY